MCGLSGLIFLKYPKSGSLDFGNFCGFVELMDLVIKLMDWIGYGICINISKIDELCVFG